MKKTALLRLAAALPLALATASLLPAQLANAGFETGDFTGWSLSTGAQATVVGAVTDYPIDPFTSDEDLSRPYATAPYSGSFQARIVAGTTALPTLETFLGLSASQLANATNDPFGLADGDALAQSLTLAAGESITLRWNFLAADSTFDDFAFFSASGPGGFSAVNTLASVSDFMNGTELGSGWQTFMFTAPTAGAYLLGIGVANFEDNTVGSILYVDGGLSAVPEPSTYGLMAALSIGAVVWLRRRPSSAK